MGLVAFWANAAQAQTVVYVPQPNTAYANDAAYPAPFLSAPHQIALPAVKVTASVGGRCGFAVGQAPNQNFTFANFDAGFADSVEFALDCTGAFRVGVVSTNGGLLTGGSVPSGYATIAPYDVQLDLRNDAGTVTATSACQAAQLLTSNIATSCTAKYQAGGSNFAGNASTSRGLRLNGAAQNIATKQKIWVKAGAYTDPSVLVAGTYADTLTVTVSAAP